MKLVQSMIGVYCCFILCLFQSCAKHNPVSSTSGEAELQGMWSGELIGGETNSMWTFRFSRDSAVACIGTQEMIQGSFTAIVNKDVNHLDVVISRFLQEDRYIGKTSLGIYKISGDTLTYAASEPGRPTRPTSFELNDSTMIFVLIKN